MTSCALSSCEVVAITVRVCERRYSLSVSMAKRSKVDALFVLLSLAPFSCLRYCALAVAEICILRVVGDARATTLRAELKQWGRLCGVMEMLWHLAEILIIAPAQRELSLTPSLVDWLNYHFPLTIPDLDAIGTGPKPELHHDYWPLFYRLLLYGRIAECRDLLRQHSQYAEAIAANITANPFVILDVSSSLEHTTPSLSSKSSDGQSV